MIGEQATRLFVHVEEPSMKQALEALLPQVLGARQVNFRIVDHGSKKRLLTDLPARLRGYRHAENVRVLVLVDRDQDDCRDLKLRLEAAAQAADLATKTNPGVAGRFRVVNRIVIEELEAWFLGDTAALCAAYPGISPTLGQKARFRDPDAVAGGTWEALLQVLRDAGHYSAAQTLPKIEVARRISVCMTAQVNRSRSFQVFVNGLEALFE